MTRIIAPALVALSVLAAAPASAAGVVVSFPQLTFPPSTPVDTTRGCVSPATVTVCPSDKAGN